MTKLSWEFPYITTCKKPRIEKWLRCRALRVQKEWVYPCVKSGKREKCWVTAVKVPCHTMCHRIPAERGRHFPQPGCFFIPTKKNFSPSSKQQNKTTEAAKLHWARWSGETWEGTLFGGIIASHLAELRRMSSSVWTQDNVLCIGEQELTKAGEKLLKSFYLTFQQSHRYSEKFEL